MNNIGDTLKEREQTHGDFKVQSMFSQQLKSLIKESAYSNWNEMDWDMQESLDMILHKIARLLAGNPTTIDTWHDIAGYATLVEKRLTKELQDEVNDI